MVSIYRLIKRVRLNHLLLFAVSLFIASILLSFYLNKKAELVEAQTPLRDFKLTMNGEVFPASGTTFTTITGAAPNTPIYWTNVISGVHSPSYQQGVTDAAGNYVRGEGNHGQYGTGAWGWIVSIGGVSKSIDFQVGSVMSLSITDNELMDGDTATISITGAPPNQPIYWSSSRNLGRNPVELDAHYNQFTDASGSYSEVYHVTATTHASLKAFWTRSVKVGSQRSSLTYSILTPYVQDHSLEWWGMKLRADAAQPGNFVGKLRTLSIPGDYMTINLCQMTQRFSVIRGKMQQVASKAVSPHRIETYAIFRPSEVIKARAPETAIIDKSVPQELLNLAQPNDIFLYWRGGLGIYPNSSIQLEYLNDPWRNTPWSQSSDLAFNNQHYEQIVMVNWNQGQRLAELKYGDKSIFFREGERGPGNFPMRQICHECNNIQFNAGLLLDITGGNHPPNGSYVTYGEFRNWLLGGGCL